MQCNTRRLHLPLRCLAPVRMAPEKPSSLDLCEDGFHLKSFGMRCTVLGPGVGFMALNQVGDVPTTDVRFAKMRQNSIRHVNDPLY